MPDLICLIKLRYCIKKCVVFYIFIIPKIAIYTYDGYYLTVIDSYITDLGFF